MAREPISKEALEAVLTKSARRCAMCFGLNGSLAQVRGQIAHVDRDNTNADVANLAHLGADHSYESRLVDPIDTFREHFELELHKFLLGTRSPRRSRAASEAGEGGDRPPARDGANPVQLPTPDMILTLWSKFERIVEHDALRAREALRVLFAGEGLRAKPYPDGRYLAEGRIDLSGLFRLDLSMEGDKTPKAPKGLLSCRTDVSSSSDGCAGRI